MKCTSECSDEHSIGLLCIYFIQCLMQVFVCILCGALVGGMIGVTAI